MKEKKTPEVLRDTSHISPGRRRLGLASICGLTIALGFLAGAVVWVVLKVMNLGIDLLWTWLPAALHCQGSLVYHLIVCGCGGLCIGFVQSLAGPLPDNMEQVMGRIKRTGSYPCDRLHIIAVCALLPLIFGGALGPEAGLSGLIAGLCCWIGDRLKCRGDQLVAMAEAGFAATLGVIFHAPLFGLAYNLEPDPGDPSEHYRTKILRKRTRIIVYCFGIAGAMLAFWLLGMLWDRILIGTGGEAGSGAGLPRFDARHAIGPSQWKWFLPLLALGIGLSLFYQAVERGSAILGRKLAGQEGSAGSSETAASDEPEKRSEPAGRSRVRTAKDFWRPLICGLIPGVCLAICGWALPMTMFSGEHQLRELIDGWQAVSPAELLLTAVLKLALTSLCVNFGWRGGSIFPIIFSGACVGYAFALVAGMDGAFAAAILISSLYAYQMRKPVAVIMVLLLCFPITYIIPVGISACIAARVPSPFVRRSPKATPPGSHAS